MHCPRCFSQRKPHSNRNYFFCLDCNHIWSEKYSLKYVQRGHKIAIANGDGVLLTPFKYDRGFCHMNTTGKFIEVFKRGRQTYVDSSGKELLPFIYDEVQHFKGNYITARKGKFWGVLNLQGEPVTPFQYQYLGRFSEGLAVCYRNYLAGFINTAGEEVIPCRYLHADEFREGLAAVQKGFYFGYINKQGEEVIPFDYSKAERFHCGLAIVEKDELNGCINALNEMIIPMDDQNIEVIGDEYFVSSENGDCLYNRDGNKMKTSPLLDKFMYDWSFEPDSCTDEKITDCLIPTQFMQYEQIEEFCFGFAPAMLKGRWGVIDAEGNQIIPFLYDRIFLLFIHYFSVELNGKYGLIDFQNNFILPMDYDDIDVPDNLDLVEVTKNGLKGVIKLSGEVIIPLIYNDIEEYNYTENGLRECYKDDHVYYINALGEVLGSMIWNENESD